MRQAPVQMFLSRDFMTVRDIMWENYTRNLREESKADDMAFIAKVEQIFWKPEDESET